jgi:hypothetical protein
MALLQQPNKYAQDMERSAAFFEKHLGGMEGPLYRDPKAGQKFVCCFHEEPMLFLETKSGLPEAYTPYRKAAHRTFWASIRSI